GADLLSACPFLHDVIHNEVDDTARFREVSFPDVDIAELLSGPGTLSFQLGSFQQIYLAGGMHRGAFDAVVTSFFIDTAENVVGYIATIRHVLRPGGLWINLGPLHWH
ncbi:unnamed protein product, partial [Phaeothamnion confervicola]